MTISTLLILVVRMSHINLVYGPARHESFVAQCLEHPTGVVFLYFFALSPRSERLEQAINNAVLGLGFVSTLTPPTTVLFKKKTDTEPGPHQPLVLLALL